MFLGESRHSIDAKGRIIVPSKYREFIGDQKLVVTRGLDANNLVVYTEEGFREYAQRWMELTTGKAQNRKLRRFVFSTAEYCDLDKQGRILLSAKHREFAGLEKDAVINGNMNSFEIWNPEHWDEVSGEFDDIRELSQEIEDADLFI